MTKRLLSFFLSVLMLLSMVPVDAIADTVDTNSPSETQEGTVEQTSGNVSETTGFPTQDPENNPAEEAGLNDVPTETENGTAAGSSLNNNEENANANETPAADPVADDVTPAADPAADVAPAADPVADDVTPAANPVADDVTPAADPATDVTPAADPATDVTPAADPAADVTPATEPKAEDPTEENQPPVADREVNVGEVVSGTLTKDAPTMTIRLFVNRNTNLMFTLNGAAAVSVQHEQSGLNVSLRGKLDENAQWTEVERELSALSGSYYITVTLLDEEPTADFSLRVSEVVPEPIETTEPTEPVTPTGEPNETTEPTGEPTEPTGEPTEPVVSTDEPAETTEPKGESTTQPTVEPTDEPTTEPAAEPAAEPADESAVEPTDESEDEPTVEPTEEQKVGMLAFRNGNGEEESDQQDANSGDGPVYPPNATLEERMRIFAEYYYGENATEPQPMLTVFELSNPTEGIHAGDSMSFKLGFLFSGAKVYDGVGFDVDPALFSQYDNVRITFHMPAGLTANFTSGSYAGQFIATPREDGGIDYSYPADPVNNPISMGSGDHSLSFTVYVQGNGTNTAIHNYNLADYLEIQYDINVPLYSNKDTPTGTYWQRHDITYIGSGANFTTVPAEGVWGANKVATGEPVDIRNLHVGDTVTLTWQIDVGLLNNDGTVKGNTTDYTTVGGNPRTGVVPIDTAKLTETFFNEGSLTSKYTKVDGTVVSVNPDKVTIVKQGSSAAPTDITARVLSATATPLELTGDLSLNKAGNVDSTGDGTANQPVDTATKYTVTATYTITEAMVADFSENGNYVLSAENSAKTEITFVNISNRTDVSNLGPIKDEQPLPFQKPAILTVSKQLTDYTGTVATYDDRYGAITYQLKSTNGESFFVYDMGTDGKYTARSSTMASSYDLPKGTYYLPFGIEYELSEVTTGFGGNMVQMPFDDGTDKLVKNPGQNEEWNAVFKNRETKGFITINKKNDLGVNLNGPKFTLTPVNQDGSAIAGAESIELEVKANGTVTSGALPYGWYKLEETYVPDGYTKVTTASDTIKHVSGSSTTGTYTWGSVFEINDNNHSYVFDAVNRKTNAQLNLNVYVGVSEATVTNKATADYGATVKLERKVDGGSWEDVNSAKNANGENVDLANYNVYQWQTAVTLPAYDADGNVYTYRFTETIPENYYDPEKVYSGTAVNGTNSGTAQTIVKEFKLAELGTDDQYHVKDLTTIEMLNRKLVRTDLTKNTYDVNANGTTTSKSKDWTMHLYSYTDTTNHSDLAQVTTTTKQVNSTNDKTDGRNWHYLPLYQPVTNADGTTTVKRVYYAVREDAMDPYVLDQAATKDCFDKTVDGTTYTFVTINTTTSGSSNMFTDTDLPAMSKRVYNVTTLTPIRIFKRDYYTNTPLANVQVEIQVKNGNNWVDAVVYNADGTKWTNGGSTPTNIVTTSSSNYVGAYVKLPGDYRFVEIDSSVPEGYHYVRTDLVNRWNTNTNYPNQDHLLLNSSQLYSNRNTQKYLTVTIYNAKQPEVRISKVDSVTTTTTLNDKGITFKVYTKNAADGSYSPVMNDDGTQLTINAQGESVATGAILEADKDYYFVEDTTHLPAGYINPNTDNAEIQALYKALGNDYDYATIDGQTVLVIKGKVKNRDKTNSDTAVNYCLFTFKNIPNVGGVKVVKKIDGKNANVSGFPVVVKNSAGEPVATQTTGTKTGDNTYTATITGLPVYDSNGEKITYTIDEGELTGDLANYYKASDAQTTTLVANKTITTVNGAADGAALVVENKTPVKLNVNKVFQNTWMMAHNGFALPMEGATIALYKKGANDTEWTYVGTATTDGSGTATFTGIEREYDYAAIEVSSPMPSMFPYQNGAWKDFLPDPAPTTLTDLSSYNVLTVQSAALIALGSNGSYNIGQTGTGDNMSVTPLVNANHWVQFDITKWLDKTNVNHVHHQTIEEATDKEVLDNCVFSLYYYVMPDGQNSVEFSPNGEGWHYANSYTSGSAYDTNGDRIPGEFLTDIVMDINTNWVFVLVEESTGTNSGAEVNPYFKYTVFTADGKTYTVTVPNQTVWAPNGTSTVTNAYPAQTVSYTIDHVNEADVLNSRLTGGNGGKDILISTFRLSKWFDSFGADGKPQALYEPLSNAKFKLYVYDYTKVNAKGEEDENGTERGWTIIADMTSGKEGNTNYALAQSGNFQLIPEDSGNRAELRDYENEGGTVNRIVEYTYSTETATKGDGTTAQVAVYKVPVILREYKAPDGYGYSEHDYNAYLIFVDETVGDDNMDPFWYFSDQYFLKKNDRDPQDNTKPLPASQRVPLAESQSGTAFFASNGLGGTNTVTVGNDHYRIVDYPTTNTIVTLHKFGYQPVDGTLNQNSKYIFDHFSDDDTVNIRMLGGVSMRLERQKENGTWSGWNNASNTWGDGTFTTEGTGTYLFNLPQGQYRIIETGLGSYASTYENTYGTNDTARYFQVGGAGIDVYMSNPAMSSITIKKTDMSGNTLLDGAVFTLTKSGTAGNGPFTTTPSGDLQWKDGQFTIHNIKTGTYTITETTAPSGYSKAYFDAVNTTKTVEVGYNFGRSTAESGKPTDTDSVITGFKANTGATVTYKDPKLGELGFTKRSGSETGDTIQATFNVWYKAFSSASGTVNVTPPPAGAKLQGDRHWWGQNGWTSAKSSWTGGTGDKLGVYELSGLEPGVYAIYEIDSGIPANHGRFVPTDNLGTVIYYVVVTGGLDVTVTGLPETRTVKAVNGTQTIDVLYKDGEAVADAFNIVNPKTVTMEVMKSIDPESMAGQQWEVKMILHSTNEKVTTNIVGYATLKNGTTSAIFKTTDGGNVEARYNIGETYYLEEQIVKPTNSASSFLIQNVVQTGVTGDLTPDATTGLYAITVNKGEDAVLGSTGSGVVTTVTNKWRQAVIIFNKVDAANNTTPVPGAEFKVELIKKDGTEVSPAKLLVKGTDYTIVDDNGVYTVTIKMESDTATYRITETKAPTPYLLNPNATFEMDVVWDDNSGRYTYTNPLLNSKGAEINVWKYNNRKTASSINFAAQGDAEFMLYELDGETWKAVRTDSFVVGAGTTAENPSFSYTAKPDTRYALVELNWNTAKYVGPDYFEGAVNNEAMAELNALEDGTISGLPDGAKAYYFDTPIGGSYNIHVYNTPYVKLQVYKFDDGLYPINVIPKATFNIYEVPADFKANDANVADFLNSNPTAVYTGTTGGNYSTSSAAAGRGTDAIWDKADPTKTYLVVEVSTAPQENGPYESINKDDNRVVWYALADKLVSREPGSTVTGKTVFLKNVYGDAAVKLTKSVDKTSLDSLLKAPDNGYQLTYTLTPSVTDASSKTSTAPSKNVALTSFVVSEGGLVFTPASSSGPQPSYSFTTITVGQSTQDVQYMKFDISDAKIKAKITYHYADGLEDTTAEADVTSASATFTVPDKVTSFDVEYYSPEVYEATRGYKLGYSFTPGAIMVNATINKLRDEPDDPVTEISKIDNTATATLTYPKWKADGSGTVEVKSGPVSAKASVKVEPVKLPKISVEKSSVPADAAQLKGTIRYTIKITNWSMDEGFVDPVVIDMLPTGVTYIDGSATVSTGSHNETFTIVREGSILGGANNTAQVEDPDGTTETSFVIALSGTLEPNTAPDKGASDSYVFITFDAFVKEAAKIYAHETANAGLEMTNYVYATTGETSFHTTSNPNGYAFTDQEGNFPLPLHADDNNDVTHELGGEATTREESMRSGLGNYEGSPYVYVGASQSLVLNTEAASVLIKAVQGDQDGGYHEEQGFLGTASRYLNNGNDRGYVHWQLSVTNGQDSPKGGYIVGDIIPKTTDGRNSVWNTEFDHIIQVAKGTARLENNQYVVYYFTGSINARNNNNALSNAIVAAKEGIPTGWTDTMPNDKASITAIIIKITDAAVKLGPGQTLVFSYETKVAEYPDTRTNPDDVIFSDVAYTNTNNTFLCTYEGFPLTNNSNQVSATILGGNVKIAGDLWIDEDWDAKQENANRRDYSKYAIINELLASFQISMTDQRTNSFVPEHAPQITEGIQNESIRHFQFDGLTPGLDNDTPLYYDPATGSASTDPAVAQLNWHALKGTNPARYILDASIGSTLTDVFKLTDYGTQHYVSDDPNTITAGAANAKDSNFMAKSDYAFETRPFFILFSENVDQSKDIGLKTYRNLEITKVAQDDPNVTISGAKFRLYGPFDEFQGTEASGEALKFTGSAGNYTLDPNGTITELETDSDGKLKINDLNWWKEYVLEEYETAPGYSLSGASFTINAAAATSTGRDSEAEGYKTGYKEVEAISGGDTYKLRIKLPATERTSSSSTLSFQVENPRGVEVPLQVVKFLNTNADKDFSFDYTLRLTNVTPASTAKLNEEMMTEPLETINITVRGNQNGDNTASNVGAFKPVSVNGAGTYTFSIQEVVPTPLPTGWTYDTGIKTATVVVEWRDAVADVPDTDEDETVKAGLYVKSITYSEPHTINGESYEKFTNAYKPTPTKAEIPVKKILTGPVPKDKTMTFEFTLVGKDNAPMPASNKITIEVTSDGSGNVNNTGKFGEITFTEVGTYTYTVTETEGNETGVTYDTTEKTVTITVTDNNGNLEAAVTGLTDGNVVVTNPYTPNPTKAEIPVKKILSGPVPANKTMSFEFTLVGKDNAPMPASNKITIEVTSDGSGNVNNTGKFGEITFTEAGTYTYTVTETEGNETGVTYDTTEKTVTITVTDNNGNLEAAVTGLTDGNVVVTNPYTPNPTKAEIPVKKILSGPVPANKTMTFEFTLVGKDNAPMPASNKITIEVTSDGSGNVSNTGKFGEITFTEVGTYTYTVTETEGNETGVTYDTASKTVTIEVTDNNGNLEAAVTGLTDGNVVVTNPYTPTPTTAEIPVKKILSGPVPANKKMTFEFTLVGKDNAPMPASNKITIEVTSDGSGNVNNTGKFGEIEFTETGTYTYTVTETQGDEPGVTYDTAPKTVTIEVTDKNGNLEAVVKGLKNGNVEVTNNYSPDDISIQIPVQKTVSGQTPPTAETFTFKIEKVGEAPMPASDTVTVIGSGSATFAAITYDAVGTYTYKVTEVVGSATGYTYDTTEHTVVVTVKDKGGSLSASYKIDDDETITSAQFTNPYTPNPTKAEIPVKKILSGPVPANKTMTFEFTLVGKDNAPMPASDKITIEVTSNGSGSVNGTGKFGEIEFTKAGTYTYTVTETKGSEPGVTYDTAPKTVTITVTDDKGNLRAVVTGLTDGNVKVTNTYEVTTVDGSKTWNDNDNQDGKRPVSITINLMRKEKGSSEDPVKFDQVTVTKEDDWKYSFTDLPMYAPGATLNEKTEYEYSVTEEPVTDYTTEIKGYDVINTHEPKKISVSVEKVWDDSDNEDEIRPATIKVQLFADDTPKGEPFELNESNEWKHTWTELDEKAAGKDIVYTVDEVAVPGEYTKVITGDAKTGFVIKNTHVPEKVEASVVKAWNDNNDEDEIRPATLVLTLLADDAELTPSKTVTLTEADNWAEKKIENLPKYKFTVNADGSVTKTEIKYTWKEKNVPDEYKLTSNTTEGTLTTITNTHTPEKVEASVVKVWEDNNNEDEIRPATLVLTLLADDAELTPSKTVTLTEADNWAEKKIENLPKYKFTVNADGSVTKTEIEYTWAEKNVPDEYELTSNTTEGTLTTITNTHKPEKVEASVKKVWDDNDDEDEIRPATLVLTLLADEQELDPTETVTLTEADDWAEKKIENLPKYKFTVNEDGSVTKTEIKYTWEEKNVPDEYELTSNTTEGTLTTITNTHTPEKVEASVKKVWDDANNQDGKRPETLTVELKADGESLDPIQTVTLTKADDWAEKKIENLPKYKFTVGEDGSVTKTEIKYTWTEKDLPEGYSLTKTEQNGTVTTLTNSYTPETTTITVIKYWNDDSDAEGERRYVKAKVLLMKTVDDVSTEIDSVNVGYQQNWTYVWTDLPVYEDGKLVTYSVKEVLSRPNGYKSNLNSWKVVEHGGSITVTNRYGDDTPGTGDNTKIKLWGSILLISAAGCAGALWVSTRKKKKENEQ